MGKIIGLTFPDPVHTCPHCGKVYKSAEGLEKHMEKEHKQQEEAAAAPPAEQ